MKESGFCVIGKREKLMLSSRSFVITVRVVSIRASVPPSPPHPLPPTPQTVASPPPPPPSTCQICNSTTRKKKNKCEKKTPPLILTLQHSLHIVMLNGLEGVLYFFLPFLLYFSGVSCVKKQKKEIGVKILYFRCST